MILFRELSVLELQQVLELMTFHKIYSGYVCRVNDKFEFRKQPLQDSRLVFKEDIENELDIRLRNTP